MELDLPLEDAETNSTENARGHKEEDHESCGIARSSIMELDLLTDGCLLLHVRCEIFIVYYGLLLWLSVRRRSFG